MITSVKELLAVEKGHFRWIIVVANFVILLPLWAPNAGFGVFLPSIAAEFGWSRGTVAAAFSIALVVGVPLGVAIGRLIDERGPWKIMVAEVVITCVSYILASTTREIWQFYLFNGVFLGVGMAGAYLIPVSTTARWFKERRGTAVGIVLAGHSLAYLVGPLLAVNLIDSYGWRGAYVIFGLALGFIGIVPAALLRNPPPSRAAIPDGHTSEQSIIPAPAAQRQSATAITLQRALKTATFWMLLMIWFLQSFAQMMFVVHVVPLSLDKGIGVAAAAAVLSIYGTGTFLGRLSSGPLSDALGSRPTTIVAGLLGALGMVVVLTTRDLMLLYLATLCFGVALSGIDTAYIRTLPDIVGTGALATMMSGLNFGWRGGAAAGPAFAGFFFDTTGDYAVPFSMGVTGLLLSVVLFVVATRPQYRLDRVLKTNTAS